MDWQTGFLFLILIFCCDLQFWTLQYVYGDFMNTRCLHQSMNTIIEYLQWTQVTVIHDSITVAAVSLPIKHTQFDMDSTRANTFLQHTHNSLFPDINIVVAVSDKRTQCILNEIDKYDFVSNGTTEYRHHSKIVIMISSVSGLLDMDQVIQNLENVAVVIVDQADECNTSVDLMEMYTLHIHPSGRVFQSVYVQDGGSVINRMFPNIKYGFNNRRLLVTTLEAIPSVIKKTENGQVTYTGQFLDVWRTVAQTLNISYDVTEPPDQDWGRLVNGEWNGIVRQLIEKEVDLAVADMTISYERRKYIDYVYPPVLEDGVDILYRRPAASDEKFFLLLRPLHTYVYITFATACLGTLLVFYFIENHRRYLNPAGNTLLIFIWEFVAVMFRQDLKIHLSTCAGKVLMSSWCLLVLIITSMYTANLIAAISSGSSSSKISTIQDLVDSDYTVGMVPAGVSYDTVKTSKRPELQKLHAKMIEASQNDPTIFVYDHRAHIRRVKKGKYAFITYKFLAQKDLAEDCELAFIGEALHWSEEYMTLALPKGSPLKFDIDRIMYKLKESGIPDVWWKNWNKPSSRKDCSVDKHVIMTVGEMSGSFLVVCGGLGVSFFVMLLEICINKYFQR